jgi:hypothetical protein
MVDMDATQMKMTLAVIVLALLSAVGASAHKDKPVTPCTAYFMVVEQDAATVNLALTGLNGPQADWYNKQKNMSICFLSADASGRGRRVVADKDDSTFNSYVDSKVGSTPLYIIVWANQLLYNRAGNAYYDASGTLNLWDTKKQDFVPVGPIHNTNATIFTSSSASLLKAGIAEIAHQ